LSRLIVEADWPQQADIAQPAPVVGPPAPAPPVVGPPAAVQPAAARPVPARLAVAPPLRSRRANPVGRAQQLRGNFPTPSWHPSNSMRGRSCRIHAVGVEVPRDRRPNRL